MGYLKRHFWGWLMLSTGWFFSGGEVCAQASREYDIKAVFLYNFASFVEWPESAFAGREAPFVVGVLGEDPFGRVLDDVVTGERVKNRPLVLRRISRIEEAAGCHILFVSGSERRRTQEILDWCRHMPVLTVADFPGFVEAGGTVGFRTEGNRLKIDMNARAARTAGLAVSSKLLKVARVIGDPSS